MKIKQIKDTAFSGHISPAFGEITVSILTLEHGPVEIEFDYETFCVVNMRVPEHDRAVVEAKPSPQEEAVAKRELYAFILAGLFSAIIGFVAGVWF